MKNINKENITVALVFIITLIFGFLLASPKQAPEDLGDDLSVSPSENTEEAYTLEEGWATYRNEDFAYSIDYPSSESVQIMDQIGKNGPFKDKNYAAIIADKLKTIRGGNPGVVDFEFEEDGFRIVTGVTKLTSENCTFTDEFTKPIEEIEVREIDGYRAEISTSETEGILGYATTMCIPKDDHTYIIMVHDYYTANDEDSDLPEKVFESFRFTS